MAVKKDERNYRLLTLQLKEELGSTVVVAKRPINTRLVDKAKVLRERSIDRAKLVPAKLTP